MKICKRCIISGRVQGVFYRNATQKEAKTRNITGWTRNLPNGDVEAIICGEQADIDNLCEWLWKGPTAAKVTNVLIEEHPLEDHHDFSIRRD